MDKTITANIAGEFRELNFSIEVMFNVAEKYGSVKGVLDTIDAGGRDAFEAVRWLTTQMANDAELCRRAAGFDHKEMLKEEDISIHIRPIDFEILTAKVVNAISAGFGREIESDEEIDLGLAELNAKKAEAGA